MEQPTMYAADVVSDPDFVDLRDRLKAQGIEPMEIQTAVMLVSGMHIQLNYRYADESARARVLKAVHAMTEEK